MQFAKKEFSGRLQPNGEICIWANRKTSMDDLVKPQTAAEVHRNEHRVAWMMLQMQDEKTAAVASLYMGLSSVCNSDKESLLRIRDEGTRAPAPKRRYGAKGITAKGRRMIRQSGYIMEREYGRDRLTFATATLPNLAEDVMQQIHENWGELVETYRRKISRHLRDKGLCGEIISVSEIQGDRYERTGIPVLHIHSLFVGKFARGKWLLSTSDHDKIWRSSIELVTGCRLLEEFPGCQVQRVLKSAVAYMAKYMSKGSAVITDNLIKNKLVNWLPRQWWNVTRTLSLKVASEVKDIGMLATYIMDGNWEEMKISNWLWHKEVSLEFRGEKYFCAVFGQLDSSASSVLRGVLEAV